MSGSSGGGGSWVTDEEIACELLRFNAQIVSPNHEVVSTLSVGDILDIAIVTSSSTQEIQVRTASGALVGGVLANKVQRLRECMLESHSYKATVLSVNSGQVRVAVQHV